MSLCCCLILQSNTPQGQLHKDHKQYHSHTRSTERKPKGSETTVTCGAMWHTLTGQQDGRKRRQARRLSVRKSMGGEEGGHEGSNIGEIQPDLPNQKNHFVSVLQTSTA